jgi:voltage-gated potassium channel
MKISSPFSFFFRGFLALVIVLLIGTLGYHFIEGWSILDALYMTITTISTVGFSEVHPLSDAGRVFTVVLIFIGVGTLFYILTQGVQFFLEGQFGLGLWRRRMNDKITKLHNHFIICGYGRVGEAVANSLKQQNAEFVAIDLRDDCVNRAVESGYLVVKGNATNSDILKQARIENARSLIVCFGDDADNLYAILSARDLNPSVTIIARANGKEATNRMKLAGAEHVIAPEAIGGQQMARLAIRPAAVKFIETVLSSKKEELLIEEIKASQDSTLIGTTVRDIETRFNRVRVLALRSDDAVTVINPEPDTVIDAAHSLTVFGPLEQLQNLEGCCKL